MEDLPHQNVLKVTQHVHRLGPDLRLLKHTFPTKVVNNLRLNAPHYTALCKVPDLLEKISSHLDELLFEDALYPSEGITLERFNFPYETNHVYYGCRDTDLGACQTLLGHIRAVPAIPGRQLYASINDLDNVSKTALDAWVRVLRRFHDNAVQFIGGSAQQPARKMQRVLRGLKRSIESFEAALQ